MLSREDFIFTIGYEGRAAVVDARAKKKYGNLSTMELAREGLFRAAFCSALYSGSDEEMREFLDYFNSLSSYKKYDLESAKRLFGVDGIPEGIDRVMNIA
ncbi:hypothetical protein WKV44_00140 [Spirochaetia bacterium 38H-sp]|uniref:Uncharacterized protein n=1 Tax=Rarispira pelagica TaxID=3141764 RepID=A0ABU9U8E4_9SPIR